MECNSSVERLFVWGNHFGQVGVAAAAAAAAAAAEAAVVLSQGQACCLASVSVVALLLYWSPRLSTDATCERIEVQGHSAVTTAVVLPLPVAYQRHLSDRRR